MTYRCIVLAGVVVSPDAIVRRTHQDGCDNLERSFPPSPLRSSPLSLFLLARYIFVYIIPSIFSAATKIYLPFAVSRLSRKERKRRRTSLNRDSSREIRRGDETRHVVAPTATEEVRKKKRGRTKMRQGGEGQREKNAGHIISSAG